MLTGQLCRLHVFKVRTMTQAEPIQSSTEPARVSTGSLGLDDILGGGLDPERVYLIEGRPGTGKTTLALQFLLERVRRGERCLYVTLSESESELRAVAGRHGWTLDGIDIFELVPPEASLDPDQELTLFHPAEMELSETTKHILDRVEAVNPSRVAFDSLSEMRLLAQSSLRYRRQILALKNFFARRQCTVVLLDDLTSQQDDLQLHSISHGVVTLEQLPLEYGAERRRLRVVKMRGIKFRGGYHDFTIETGGLAIYPRLIAAEHHKSFIGKLTSTGSSELDALLGGGIERGTSLLLIGGAGVGKSSIALTYAMAAAERGEGVVVFAFDEGLGTAFARAAGLGMRLQEHVAFVHEFFETFGGLLALYQIPGCLVLPTARTQRRTGRADKRHGLDGTFLERHVAQHFQEALGVAMASRVVVAGCQNNKWEIRPWRLVAHPIKQWCRIGSEKGLLGNNRHAGASLQLDQQITDPGARFAGQIGLLQKRTRSFAIPAYRGKHEDPLCDRISSDRPLVGR